MNTEQLSIFDMPLQSYKEPEVRKFFNPEPKVEDVRSEAQRNRKVSYDVGEKIGGARKDIAKQKKEFLDKPSLTLLNDLEKNSVDVAAEVIIRDTFFSWFSLEDCRERNVVPGIAKAMQLFINRIPKSAKDTPEDRRKYVTMLTYMSDILQTVKTKDEYYNFELRLFELISINEPVEIIENRFAQRIEELSNIATRNEKESLIREIQEIQAKLHMFDLAQKMAFHDYAGPFFNYFRRHNSRVSSLSKAFAVKSYDELIPIKDKKSANTRTKRKVAWERVLPEQPVRSGGESIVINNPKAFVEHFGFRASEFGHYVDDQTGKNHLFRSAEAFTDLAELLDIPTEAVSLKQELAMAFGARGRGNALGHYEPARKVINLTKEKGSLGILAHEWFHALDHYLYNASHSFKNGKVGFLTDNNNGELPVHVQNALDHLLEVIKTGNSVAYIDVSACEKTYRVGRVFQETYLMADGDLQNFMDLIMRPLDRQAESMLSGIVSESYLEKQIAKYARKRVRELKKMAEALAGYHKEMTGEVVTHIPYSTDRSQYYQSAINLDKGKDGKYWSSNTELTARAFEGYIFEKLKGRNWTSDYLVCGVRDSVFPQGLESELIYLAMDKLIDAIRPLLVEGTKNNEADFSFLNN